MAIFSSLTSLLLSFILSGLSIALAAEFDYNKTCHSFQCGDNQNITFPFFNVSHRSCGLYEIECIRSKPTIQIGESGRFYSITNISYPKRQIVVQDRNLYDRLEAKDCNSVYNFVPPNFSMKVTSTNITFFSCKKDTAPPQGPFEIYEYTGCKNSVLYYTPEDSALQPLIPPTECSVFQFPVFDSLLLFSSNWTDKRLLSLLNKGFTLTWRPQDFCDLCNHEGGLCWNRNITGFDWCCNLHCWSDHSNSSGDKNEKLKLTLIAIPSAFGIVTIILVLICLLQKKLFFLLMKKKDKNSGIVDKFFRTYDPPGPIRYNYRDVKKMFNSSEDELGKGGFGSVYKGKLPDGRQVAVKVLSESKGNGEEFINEVASISRTEHVNIVSLLGYCYEGSKKALIYEFMPNGSLDKIIYNKEPRTSHALGWAKLYEIAVGTARGLEYLHGGCNTRILHFDIKPHNILLDKDFSPKISDFGLAKLCPTRQSTISMLDARGTAGYIAPEVYCRNVGGVSSKSDVYSYGMMVLEMVGGRKNIDALVENTSEIYFPHWIHKRLDLDEDLGLGGNLTEEEEEIVRKMIIVGLWCIQVYPVNRPSMSTVLEMLEGSLEGLQMPPEGSHILA